jgi:hypothetical protein
MGSTDEDRFPPVSQDPVPDATIGPPKRSGSDFFLPPRPAKSLDAAQIRITSAAADATASAARAKRIHHVIRSLFHTV